MRSNHLKKKKKTLSTRQKIIDQQAALGWSDYDLAAASGVDRSLIGKYRRGQIDIGTEKADAMRAAMQSAIRNPKSEKSSKP